LLELLAFWVVSGLIGGGVAYLLLRMDSSDEDEPDQLPPAPEVPQLPAGPGDPYRTPGDVAPGQPLIIVRSEQPAPMQLVRRLFTPREQQLTLMRAWSEELYWNFTEEDFAKAEAEMPDWPDGGLIAVVLVPYFKCEQETFETLWSLACRMNPDAERTGAAKRKYFGSGLYTYEEKDDEQVKLEKLCWRTVDLRANRGKNPSSLKKINAGAAVLAAAALHPAWLQAMDGETVPYVWLPGYRFKDGHGKNAETPRLSTREVADTGMVLKGGIIPWRGDLPGTERRALVMHSTRSTNTSYSFAAPEYYKK